MIDLDKYQILYDSGLSLDKICSQDPDAKYHRFFLQKNLKFRTRSQATILAQSGTHLSESHRKSISKARQKYLLENPDEVPYRKYHYSKGRSYPEIHFESALVRHNLEGWVAQYQHSIYTYDFAFVELKIDVEIDGSTHLLDSVKKLDQRRDAWSIDQGWKVIRFTARDVLKDVDLCIFELKSYGNVTQQARVLPLKQRDDGSSPSIPTNLVAVVPYPVCRVGSYRDSS